MRYREGLGARPGVGREEGPEEQGGALPPFLRLVLGGLCHHTYRSRQVPVPFRRFWGSGAAQTDYGVFHFLRTSSQYTFPLQSKSH